jgi:hypothetical protein
MGTAVRDPRRSVSVPQSRRSPNPIFCETELPKAAVGDLTLPASPVGRGGQPISLAEVAPGVAKCPHFGDQFDALTASTAASRGQLIGETRPVPVSFN